MPEIDDDQILSQISQFVEDAMQKFVAIKGVAIGTDLATPIYSRFKSEPSKFNENHLVASATSFRYIANSLFNNITKNLMNKSYITVENYVVLVQIFKDVSAALILDRKLGELEGIERYQKVLDDILLNVSAVNETYGFIQADPLVKVMRAVPSATYLAFISREGIPIKTINDGSVENVIAGSQIAALSNLTMVMLNEPMDYTIMSGDKGIVMLMQFDYERILTICIPDHKKAKIGEYLAKIKEIIKIEAEI
ncbi:MAG: hypothetical protein ACTSVU_00935 [Promethearchaeota archaeon]